MSLAVTEKFSLIGVIFQRRCNHEGGCIEKWAKHTKKERTCRRHWLIAQIT